MYHDAVALPLIAVAFEFVSDGRLFVAASIIIVLPALLLNDLDAAAAAVFSTSICSHHRFVIIVPVDAEELVLIKQ